MHKLTVKQQRILDIIVEYIRIKGYPPTYREIGEVANVKSSSTIQQYLDKLKSKGYVTWLQGQPRTLKVIKQEQTAS
jgi:SOS-response transcriptional repressor LexA